MFHLANCILVCVISLTRACTDNDPMAKMTATEGPPSTETAAGDTVRRVSDDAESELASTSTDSTVASCTIAQAGFPVISRKPISEKLQISSYFAQDPRCRSQRKCLIIHRLWSAEESGIVASGMHV